MIKPLMGAGAPFGRPFEGRKPTGGVTVPFPFSVEELMVADGEDGARIWRVEDSLEKDMANLCDESFYSRKSEVETRQMVWIYMYLGLLQSECEGKTLCVWEW